MLVLLGKGFLQVRIQGCEPREMAKMAVVQIISSWSGTQDLPQPFSGETSRLSLKASLLLSSPQE